MPGAKSKHLIEEVTVSLLDRSPELLQARRDRKPAQAMLLVGDVLYGQSPESVGSWAQLKGTSAEIRSIENLVGGRMPIKRLDQSNATELSITKEFPSAGVAHFATHGFFKPTRNRAANAVSWEDGLLAAAAARNPLSRCGLVMASANGLPELDNEGIPYGSDGLLTGEELCDLDLRNVGLVVLSACETGLGEIADNEGAFGLHRALSPAGVDATIGSLWKVSDDATAQLMEEFYRQLFRGDVGAADALRAAQLKMLRGDGDLAAPFFWAAFMASGDAQWTPY